MSPHRKSSSTDPVRRLMALAQAAAEAGPDVVSSAEDQLIDRVIRVLDRGSDRPIIEAVERLDAQHAHAAADLLVFWADDAAETMDVMINAREVGEVTTFLVPIIFAAPGDTVIPLMLPSNDIVTRLAKSFRQHHLVGADPTLAVMPHLFRLADLPTSWSGRRRWLKVVVTEMSTPQPSTLQATPEPPEPGGGPPEFPSDPASGVVLHFHLRFLLGVVVSDGHDQNLPIWDAPSDSLDEIDKQDRLLEAWRRTVTTLLEEVVSGDSVIFVEDPNLWQDALANGLDLWNRVVLEVLLNAFCQHHDAAPEDVGVDIRWNVDEAGWQWAFTYRDQMGPPTAWMGTEDPAEERDALLDSLHAYGIRRIALDERGYEG